MLGQLRQRLQAVASVRLPGLFLGGLRRGLADLLAARSFHGARRLLDRAHELLFRQARVPDVQGAHLGELGHLHSIRRDRLERRGARIGSVETVVPCRDRKARRHALHVVLEWPRKRLVEVVQSEQQRSFGRRERTEVREVRVAAQLHVQAGSRRVLEIRRHDLRRAPIERERRDQHPPMTDGYEVGLPSGVLLLEQCDRIGTIGSRRPSGVHRRRHLLTRSLPSRASFINARVHDCGHETPSSVATGSLVSLSGFGTRPGLQVGRCDRCMRRCDSPERSEQVEGMLRRGREIDVLAIVVDEARNQRSRAEPPQLLAVGCRGRECHGITNRDERFRPRRRTAAKREHVVHPHAVPACPPRLALPPTSYLHVPGAMPDCTIAKHEDRDPGRAQPERNTEYCKDRPDHRHSLALASTPATEPPTRCRRYPDSAGGSRIARLPNADSTRHPAGMTIGILQRNRELTRMRRRHPNHPGCRHLRQSRRGGGRLRPSHGREEERRVRPHRGCRDHQGRRRQGRGRAPRQHCEASRLGRCARRRCAVRDRAAPRAHRARSSVVAPAQRVLRVPVASRVTSGTTSRRRPPAR